MKRGIILTLPRHDDVTEYFAKFSIEIEDAANSKGLIIKKLLDRSAEKSEFEKVLSKLDFNLIVFNGHGSESSIKGYKNQIIIESGVNDQILKDRIIYARSCHAALKLGRNCMKDSNKGCFIGYNIPFIFLADSLSFSNPLKDNIARLFLEPSNLVPISLIKGNTTKTAHDNSKKQILKNINKVLRTNSDHALLIAGNLWNNYIGQELIGNPDATINLE